MARGVRAGNEREVAVAKGLEHEGWLVASRRHTGGAGDLLAVKFGETWLIEVKSTTDGPYKTFGRLDRAAMSLAAEKVGAKAVLAWWPPRKPLKLIFEADWPH